MFFNFCDEDNDGFIDASKIERVVLLGYTKEEKRRDRQEKGFTKNNVDYVIDMIEPVKRRQIRESDLINAC